VKIDNNKSCWLGNPDSQAAGREIQAEEKGFFQMPELVRASWIHIHLAIKTTCQAEVHQQNKRIALGTRGRRHLQLGRPRSN